MRPPEFACLQAIKRLSAGGVAPSYAEIAVEMGRSPRSRAGICGLVARLEAQGLVRREGARRALRLIAGHPAYAPAALKRLPDAEFQQLAGSVAAERARRVGGLS